MTQEVDDPFQLDMSELCLSEGLSRNMRDNGTGKITKMDLYSLLLPMFTHSSYLFLSISCLAVPLSTEIGCARSMELTKEIIKMLPYLTKLNKSIFWDILFCVYIVLSDL